MAPRRTPLHSDSLSLSRCKRAVRPFISKVHSLYDLNQKYSSLLVHNFPLKEALSCFRPDSTAYSENEQSRKAYNEIKGDKRRKKADYIVPKSNIGIDSDNLDYSYEETDSEERASVSPIMQSTLLSRQVDAFVSPKDSFARLLSMKPFITVELYDSYVEVFQIFRNIVTSFILSNHPLDQNSSKIPRLSTLSSLKIGKMIALSTKSSFYKLNQALLFDPNTLPIYLKEVHNNLNDDIDYWFEVEPTIVIESYRLEFILGYFVHLVVFYLKLVLYCLMPVLIHWLFEQAQTDGPNSQVLFTIMNTMFSEYWSITSQDHSDIDCDTTVLLNGNDFRRTNTRSFWILFKIGYWSKFVHALGLQSNFSSSCNSSLILETMPVDDKINLEVINEIDSDLSERETLIHDIYGVIKANPQHPILNSVLVKLFTELLSETRSRVGRCTNIEDIEESLSDSYLQLNDFLNIWLGLSNESSLIFNSLYPGNELIFEATSMLLSFIKSKATRTHNRLVRLIDGPYSVDAEKVNQLVTDINTICKNSDMLMKCVDILRGYFLDNGKFTPYFPYSENEISRTILQILLCESCYASNRELNDFLLWLYERGELALLELAQSIFKRAYDDHDEFDDDDIEEIGCLLFP